MQKDSQTFKYHHNVSSITTKIKTYHIVAACFGELSQTSPSSYQIEKIL